MTNSVTVINLTPGQVAIEAPPDAAQWVNRQDIANNATALLLALQGGPEAAGVVMLARALGCEIKQVIR